MNNKLTLSEIEADIQSFEAYLRDKRLTDEQRAIFEEALKGATKQREQLLQKVKTDKKPAAVSIELDPAVRPPAISVKESDKPQKKTAVRTSAQVVDTTSRNNKNEIVVKCDLEAISNTTMIFHWGNSEEHLTPRLTVWRFKARVDNIVRLEHKKLAESRSFHRAVAYYTGLVKFCGKELSPTDFRFKGRKARVLQTIQEAYREQQKANA